MAVPPSMGVANPRNCPSRIATPPRIDFGVSIPDTASTTALFVHRGHIRRDRFLRYRHGLISVV